MKTKISHLGRRSVSVILAVMMLLSTMLIGTVSTVNAIGADSSYTVHEGETLYLNLSNTGATEANFFEGNYILKAVITFLLLCLIIRLLV